MTVADASETDATEDQTTNTDATGTGEGQHETLPDDHPLVKTAAARKAENAELRAKLKEFEDAQLSETDRLTNSEAEQRQRADNAESELTRLRVALKFNIPEADIHLLGSGTAEELEAKAQRLSELLGAKNAGKSREDGVVESLGRSGDSSATDVAQLLNSIPRF